LPMRLRIFVTREIHRKGVSNTKTRENSKHKHSERTLIKRRKGKVQVNMADRELERNLLELNLQHFADEGEGGTDAGSPANAGTELSAEQRLAELEKQLAEKDNAIAEAEKKYGKLKSTMDVKLKELGDMTKRERERMTAEELERKQIEEIKEQNAMLLKEREVVNAERRFIQSGCDADLATEGAQALIDRDFDGLFSVIDKLVANKIAGEKSALLKTMPKPQGGSSSTTITQEQFDQMNYKERAKLFENDPETYNKFK